MTQHKVQRIGYIPERDHVVVVVSSLDRLAR